MDDPFNLRRFVDAQERVIDDVLAELAAGQKRTHWMWFIFPQIQGLGQSPMARRFAISSLAEAAAYLAHPILGPRLRRCAELVLAIDGRSIDEIFGYPDDLKFHSSMTLFHAATTENALFRQALDKYFGGESDQSTVDILGALGNLPETPM